MADERRDRLAEAYGSAFDGWLELTGQLDGEAWSTPTGCPGWDVRDQLAHVVALERVLLGDVPDEVTLPDDLPHVRHDAGRYVEAGVQARRGLAPPELVAEARATFERRRAQLRALDPGYLDEQVEAPGHDLRLRGAQLLRTRIFDITCHEYDVRRAVGRPTASGRAHEAIAAELVVRGWARALPAAIGLDAVLGVALDGVELARLHLGTGELFRGADGPDADAVLDVGLARLLAIAGGRTDAPTLDELVARGDLEVVRAVLASGTITP